MFFIEVLKEVLFDVDKILNVLSSDGESVEEEIETVVLPFPFSQQLDYAPQNQVLLLLVIFHPDISHFLYQLGCSTGTQVIISALYRE